MSARHLYFQEIWNELMKDSLSSAKKNKEQIKTFSKVHFFDTVIILLLLNIAAVAVIVFYFQRIYTLTLPQSDKGYLKVNSVPLPTDLDSINASAAAFVVYDTSTRTVVASKNKNLRFSPASTAKVMSAILVLEHYDLDQFLTVPLNIYSIGGSSMHLAPGEEVSVRTLLYGMMLPSGNDAAYTLSYYYKSGTADFVADMNRKAKELGLFNTYFLDPAGYEDGNYTTGEELVRLGAYAMENKEFRQIVKTRYVELSNRANTHTYSLRNLNELLVFDNVLGIKTGFTNEAGGVLLTAIQKGDSIFVVAVLKSQDRFYDTKDLMSFIVEKVNFSLPPESLQRKQ